MIPARLPSTKLSREQAPALARWHPPAVSGKRWADEEKWAGLVERVRGQIAGPLTVDEFEWVAGQCGITRSDAVQVLFAGEGTHWRFECGVGYPLRRPVKIEIVVVEKRRVRTHELVGQLGWLLTG